MELLDGELKKGFESPTVQDWIVWSTTNKMVSYWWFKSKPLQQNFILQILLQIMMVKNKGFSSVMLKNAKSRH